MTIMVNVQTGNMLDVVVEGKSIGLKQRDSDHRKYEIIWLPRPEGLRDVLTVEIDRLRPGADSGDFRSRAIQLCKDKAAEWWKNQYEVEGQASALLRAQADTANELAAEIEKL